MQLSNIITVQLYDDDVEPFLDSATVEVNEGMIDLIAAPYTGRAVTYSFDVEQVWRLIRKLADSAAAVQSEDE